MNKNISSIQRDMNRWKEHEQQFSAEEEEMYDVEDSLLAPRSTTVIDLVTDCPLWQRWGTPPNNPPGQ